MLQSQVGGERVYPSIWYGLWIILRHFLQWKKLNLVKSYSLLLQICIAFISNGCKKCVPKWRSTRSVHGFTVTAQIHKVHIHCLDFEVQYNPRQWLWLNRIVVELMRNGGKDVGRVMKEDRDRGKNWALTKLRSGGISDLGSYQTPKWEAL